MEAESTQAQSTKKRSAYVEFLNKWKKSVLIVSFLVAIPALYYAITLFDNLSDGGSTDPTSESIQALYRFGKKFATATPDITATMEHPTWKVTDENFKNAYKSFKAKLMKNRDVIDIISPIDYPTVEGLISNDGRKALLTFRVRGGGRSNTADTWKAMAAGNPLTFYFTGTDLINTEVSTELSSALITIEAGSIPVLVFLLVFTYGGIVAIIPPIILAIFTLIFTLCSLHIVQTGYNVSTYVTDVAAAFGVGIAIDFTIFLYLRYTEELKKNKGNPALNHVDAVDKMLHTSGRTVLFSGVILATTLSGALQFSEYYLTTMSLTMMFVAAFACIGALLIVPCIFLYMEDRIFYLSTEPLVNYVSTILGKYIPFCAPKPEETKKDEVITYNTTQGQSNLENGNTVIVQGSKRKIPLEELITADDKADFWFSSVSFVLRYSFIFCFFITGAMVALTAVFCSQVKFAGFSWANLPVSSTLRYPYESVQSDFATLGPGEIDVYLECNKIDSTFIRKLYQFCSDVESYPTVNGVSSMVNLDDSLTVEDYIAIYSDPFNPAYFNYTQLAIQPFYYTNLETIAVVIITLGIKNSDIKVGRTVRYIRNKVSSDFNVNGTTLLTDHGVSGLTALDYDVLLDIANELGYFIAVLVCMMTFFVIIQTGSLILPFKVVITSFLSICSSFCFLMFVFQNNDGSDFLQFYNNFEGLDELQLLFVFVVGFGLSLDYEIFILGRIQEIYEKTGNNHYAVAKGVSSSAKSITMAAILLCTAIGGFLAADIIVLKLIGMGIGLTVVLDATVIRCIFLPSIMGIMGDCNWWAPAPLKKFVVWLGLQEKND